MTCPKCDESMDKIKFQSIEIDRCTFCNGIWFDYLEKEDLKALEGSESIDIGNKNTGEQFNKIDDIKCPKCNVQMRKMVDSKQPHIWFESCTVCFGSFFDAGEFKDYKEENLLSYLKSFLAGKRQ